MRPVVSALLTCHNRREKTLAGLASLFASDGLGEAFDLDVWLVDDGSSDGTGDAVRAAFPSVRLLGGDGSLFWAGGMRVAFAAAVRTLPDFLLLLNDDTRLAPDAVLRLLATHAAARAEGEEVIAVGTTADATGAVTYGGVRRVPAPLSLRYEVVPPADAPQPSDTLNMNIALVPRRVYTALGNLEGAFSHALADFDYGLRARAAGFGVRTASGVLGECAANPVKGSWRDEDAPLAVRWRRTRSPKGLPPREWLLYTRRHGGPRWPLFFALPYARLVLTSLRPRRRG